MTAKKALVSALKILAVCFVFALCFMVRGALSGLDKIGQQAASSNTVQPVASAQQAASSASEAPTKQLPPQMPENFLPAFLTISICVGVVLSYLILRSNWHGWTLVATLIRQGYQTILTTRDNFFYIVNMKNQKKEPKRYDPLGEFETLVLMAILRLGEDAYGMRIHVELEERAGRRSSYGALYTTLDRLEQKGYVSSSTGEQTPERGGRAKKYFQIRAPGEAALKQAFAATRSMASGLEPLLGGGL